MAGGGTVIGAAEMDALPDLRAVANFGVGYDNVDVEEATRRGIVVSNTPDVLTDAVADLAVGAGARRDAPGRARPTGSYGEGSGPPAGATR